MRSEEDGRFWLSEGFHRYAALTAAGFAEAPCDVRPGGLRDAILHSAGANANHGVRRSLPDRRRCVLMVIDDPEWGTWSDREVARRCNVSPDLVAAVRREITAGSDSEPAPRTYRDRHGNVSQMRVGRIGRQAAEPADRQQHLLAIQCAALSAAQAFANVVRYAVQLDGLARGDGQ